MPRRNSRRSARQGKLWRPRGAKDSAINAEAILASGDYRARLKDARLHRLRAEHRAMELALAFTRVSAGGKSWQNGTGRR